MSDAYKFSPRGIGSDNTPGCFVCGGEYGLHENISAFVESREDGEAVVKLFNTGARLDFREREPNWIQVKIGCCERHLPNLIWLDLAVKAYQYRIKKEIVDSSMFFQVVDSRKDVKP